jgi:hypothetical protein
MIMVFYSTLGAFAVAFVVLGVVAALVSLGVLTSFVRSNRRERLARHESVRSYYGGLALTH